MNLHYFFKVSYAHISRRGSRITSNTFIKDGNSGFSDRKFLGDSSGTSSNVWTIPEYGNVQAMVIGISLIIAPAYARHSSMLTNTKYN